MSDRYIEYGMMAGVFVGIAIDNIMAGLAIGALLGIGLNFYEKNLKKNKKTNSITQRLQELEAIKTKDLISDSEYKAKKEEIIKDL